MNQSTQDLCEDAASERQRWDSLRPRLQRSLERLHAAVHEHLCAVWKADVGREALRNARLDLHRTRVLGSVPGAGPRTRPPLP